MTNPGLLARSEAQGEAILRRATDAALDEACRIIQDHLGVKHGDFASLYWAGQREDAFREMLRAYMDAERADIAALRDQSWYGRCSGHA